MKRIRVLLRRIRRYMNILVKPIVGYEHLDLISRKPYIFLSSYYDARKKPFLYLTPVASVLIFHRVHWLFLCTWNITPELARKAAGDVARFNRIYKRHKVIFLTNTIRQSDLFKQNKLDAIFFNHNALVSEYVFKPLFINKKYNALYDARLFSFKRHWLSQRVSDLALISFEGFGDSTLAYRKQTLELLQKATWLSESNNDKMRWLDLDQINIHLNEAKVGLCLSAEEGAMRASIQYLLAGLPVVTTVNEGGRDEFFDEAYVKWVGDTPESVANGVAELVKINLDPNMIRSRTLELVYQHRQRFAALIRDIYKRENVKYNFDHPLDSPFYGSLNRKKVYWKDILGKPKKSSYL